MAHVDGAVRVAIRVRPLVSIERAAACESVVSYPSHAQVQLAGSHTFTYDHAFTEASTQAEVYEACAAPLVRAFFEGFNATILAYGQTGSGKTWTMGTASAASVPKQDLGIIPRVIHELHELMKAKEKTHVFSLSVSFLEIYNDDIFDLLCTIPRGRADRPVPVIKEGRHGGIEVDGMVKQEVKSAEETMEMLDRGSANRAVGSTNMNATSSRSHAIFTLSLAQKLIESDELGVSNDEFITSKFHFVDLAGSERLKRTGAVGERMKEGININQGLLALGNVISALGDPTRKGAHVPFRDSKITRLLQDSLGGNSQTLMVAAVSPADVNREETLNTLQYANRAKNIKNAPVKNIDPVSHKFNLLRGHIKALEAELAIYREGQVPTQEQRAAFAAMAESIAQGGTGGAPVGAGGAARIGGSSGFPGTSGGGGLLPSIRGSSSALDLGPTLSSNQIAVDAEQWAQLHLSLEQHERELRRVQDKNKRLYSDVNERNEARLAALASVESWKCKLALIAQQHPQVKEQLIAEKAAVEKETAEIRAAVAAANGISDDATIAAAAVPSADEAGAGDGDDFFTLLCPGGDSNPLNARVGLFSTLQADHAKLSAKYREKSAKLAAAERVAARAAKEHEAEVRRLRARLRDLGAPDLYGDAAADEEDEELDDEDDLLAEGDEADQDGGGSTSRRARRSKNGALPSPSEGSDMQSPSSLASMSSQNGELPSSSSLMLHAADLSDVEDSPDASGLGGALSDAEEEQFHVEQRLATLSSLKEREHERALSLLDEEDRALGAEISAKEAFLAQLESEKARAQAAREMYLAKMSQLEQNLEQHMQRIAELEKIAAKGGPSTAGAAGGAASGGGLSAKETDELKQLREKHRQVQREYAAQKAKLKELELLKSQHAKDELRIRSLATEIESAKAARVLALRKAETQRNEHKAWKDDHERQLALLRKDKRKNEDEVRRLKADAQLQAIQLKRAREANSVLQGKVREQDSSAQVRKAAAAAKAAGVNRNNRAGSVGSGAGPRGARSKGPAGGGGHRRQNTRDNLPNPSSGSSRGGGKVEPAPAPTTQLSHPVHARAFAEDVRSLLREEGTRMSLERAVAHLERQEQSEIAAHSAAEVALETAEDPSAEEWSRLEEDVRTRQLCLEATRATLSRKREELEIFYLSHDAELDDKVEKKLRNVLGDRPNRIVAEVIKVVLASLDKQGGANALALVAGGAQEGAGDDTAAAALIEQADAASGAGIDLASTFSSPRSSLAAELTAIRKSAGGAGPGAFAPPPAQQQQPSKSQRGSVSSGGSPYKDKQQQQQQQQPRRSQADAHAAAMLQAQQLAQQQQQQGEVVEYKYSPLQAHFVCPFGIVSSRTPAAAYSLLGSPLTGSDDASDDEVGSDGQPQQRRQRAADGEDEDEDPLEPVPVSIEAQAQAAALTAAYPQTIFAHSGGAMQQPLHNNFTSESVDDYRGPSALPPSAAIGADGSDKKPLSRPTSSVLSKARQGDLVFERLTNPQNFTGAQKAKFDSGITQANQAQVQALTALSNSRGRGGHGSVNQAAGAQNGAGLSSGPLRKLTASNASSATAAGGGPLLASALSGSQSARLLAATSAGSGTDRSPSPSEHPESHAALARLPFHERLSDPRTFTGAQKQKFADPHPKTARVGGSGGALGLRDSVPSVPVGGRAAADEAAAAAAAAAATTGWTGGRPGHASHRSMSFDRSAFEEGPGSGGGPRSAAATSSGGRRGERGAGKDQYAQQSSYHSAAVSPVSSTSSSTSQSYTAPPTLDALLAADQSFGAAASGSGGLDKENRGESMRGTSVNEGSNGKPSLKVAPLLSSALSPAAEEEGEEDTSSAAASDLLSPAEVIPPNFFISPRTQMHDAAAAGAVP